MLSSAFRQINTLIQEVMQKIEIKLSKTFPSKRQSSFQINSLIAVNLKSKFRLYLKQFQMKLQLMAHQTLAQHFQKLTNLQRPCSPKANLKLNLRHQHSLKKEVLKQSVKIQKKNDCMEFCNFQQFLAYIHKVNQVKDLALKFSSFGITDNGSPHLGNSLLKYTGLKRFFMDLSHNSIGQEGICRIAQSLTKLQSIQRLEINLMNNRIKQQGITSLMKNISTLKNLQVLKIDLSSNFIGPYGLLQIGKNSIKLQKLKSLQLVLYENRLNDQSIRTLIKHLQKIMELRQLTIDLRVNQLSSSVYQQLMKLSKERKIDKFQIRK